MPAPSLRFSIGRSLPMETFLIGKWDVSPFMQGQFLVKSSLIFILRKKDIKGKEKQKEKPWCIVELKGILVRSSRSQGREEGVDLIITTGKPSNGLVSACYCQFNQELRNGKKGQLILFRTAGGWESNKWILNEILPFVSSWVFHYFLKVVSLLSVILRKNPSILELSLSTVFIVIYCFPNHSTPLLVTGTGRVQHRYGFQIQSLEPFI